MKLTYWARMLAATFTESEATFGLPGLTTWERQVAFRIFPLSNVSMAVPPSITGMRSEYARELRLESGRTRHETQFAASFRNIDPAEFISSWRGRTVRCFF